MQGKLRQWVIGGLLCLYSSVGAADLPVVKVGMGDSQPPYLIAEPPGGIEYEIVQGVLELAGYRMQAEFMPLARMHSQFRSDGFEAAATVSESSGLPGFYSEPYIAYRHAAIALAERKLDIKSIADLGRYSVASFQTARRQISDEFRQMADANPNYQEVSPQNLRNNLLYLGRVDVVVGDPNIFFYLNREVPPTINTKQATTVYQLFKPRPFKLVFHQRQLRDQFNEALIKFKASARYRDIQLKYRWQPSAND